MFSGVVVSGAGVGSESVGSGCVGAVAEDSDVVVAFSAGKQLDAIFFSFLLRSRDNSVLNGHTPNFLCCVGRFCLNSLGNNLNTPIRWFFNCDFEALLRNTALSEYNRRLLPQTTIELRSTQTLLCTCPDRAYINNI